jgi:hypothetical protein
MCEFGYSADTQVMCDINGDGEFTVLADAYTCNTQYYGWDFMSGDEVCGCNEWCVAEGNCCSDFCVHCAQESEDCCYPTDDDSDGIWDYEDDCAGEIDQCGVCNGDGFSCCPTLGDGNDDGGYNVLDIVVLANCILTGTCNNIVINGLVGCGPYVVDMNGDGGYNVLDIVALANCILNGTCGIEGTPGQGKYAPPAGMSEEVHRGILEKILNAGEDINQIKSILDREVSNIQTTPKSQVLSKAERETLINSILKDNK